MLAARAEDSATTGRRSPPRQMPRCIWSPTGGRSRRCRSAARATCSCCRPAQTTFGSPQEARFLSDSAAWLDDWRRLGVAVKRIVIRSDIGALDIPSDHPALTEGWYRVERDGTSQWRWTDGTRLPVDAAAGPTMVEVHVAITTQYPVATPLAA